MFSILAIFTPSLPPALTPVSPSSPASLDSVSACTPAHTFQVMPMI